MGHMEVGTLRLPDLGLAVYDCSLMDCQAPTSNQKIPSSLLTSVFQSRSWILTGEKYSNWVLDLS